MNLASPEARFLTRPRRVVGLYAPLPQRAGLEEEDPFMDPPTIADLRPEDRSDRSGPVLGPTREYLARQDAREQYE